MLVLAVKGKVCLFTIISELYSYNDSLRNSLALRKFKTMCKLGNISILSENN